ncbi:MAG TPA: hypothetical protein PK513_00940 [Alphaproteobacteria bacterium]|nr:MAG: hypothetical protein H6859_01335 [Rhodospirillales bacterium]HOO81054.1 hypothetical protein [Alphaproteobacteria bacterium]
MSLSDKNPSIDRFFDPVINCTSHNELRTWLKKQNEEDIRTFLDTYNFDTNQAEKSILRQELERRSSIKNQKDKWIDRIIGFVFGILSGFLINSF